MDRQYIRDHQVIERYLKGELSADEEQAFEETYLADQELLDEIELVERLGGGLKRLRFDGGIAAPRPAARFRVFASPQFAAAASVLLVVSLVFSGVMYRENLSLRTGGGLVAGGGGTRILPLISGSGSTRVLPLIPVRGGPEIVVEAPDASELTVLLVDPGFTPHDRYRAVISRRDDATSTQVWVSDNLVPSYEDQLAIALPGQLLTPGTYGIDISGRMNDWPAARASDVVQQLMVKVVPP